MPDGVDIVATRNKWLQYKKSLSLRFAKVFHNVCILMIIQNNKLGILESQKKIKIQNQLWARDVNRRPGASGTGKKYIRKLFDWVFIYSRSRPTCNRPESDELSKLAKSKGLKCLKLQIIQIKWFLWMRSMDLLKNIDLIHKRQRTI